MGTHTRRQVGSGGWQGTALGPGWAAGLSCRGAAGHSSARGAGQEAARGPAVGEPQRRQRSSREGRHGPAFPPGSRRGAGPAPAAALLPRPAAAGLAQRGAARFLPGAAGEPPRRPHNSLPAFLRRSGGGGSLGPGPGRVEASAGGGAGTIAPAAASRAVRTALCIRLFLPPRRLRRGSRRGPYVPGRERGEGLRLGVAAASAGPPRRQGPGAGAAAGSPRCAAAARRSPLPAGGAGM